MSRRVTIMIDDDLDKKLRLVQAKMIQQKQTSYSYSKVLNETLRKILKQFFKLNFTSIYVQLFPTKWFNLLPKQADSDDFTLVKST